MEMISESPPTSRQGYSELVRNIVSKIVDHPNDVEVNVVDRGRTIVVELDVAPEDMGKIIGKAGRNIDALRSIVRAAGLVNHERVHVELLESDDDGDSYDMNSDVDDEEV